MMKHAKIYPVVREVALFYSSFAEKCPRGISTCKPPRISRPGCHCLRAWFAAGLPECQDGPGRRVSTRKAFLHFPRPHGRHPRRRHRVALL